MRRNTDRICLIAIVSAAAAACLYLFAVSFGLIGAKPATGYESRLFDQSRVHTLDIVMADWDSFLETCQNEEYAACTVSIDGEPQGSVAIRAKGNTSLSSVAQYGNNRYSFKLEFDQYESGKSYYGLDKLSLNNLIQDKTYLKDYMAYTLMNKMDVSAPLCSFVQITVNGEDWGLYLAVEGVEESFLTRNYGADHGELYKPDSLSFGGGRGQGKDFDMSKLKERFANQETSEESDPSSMTEGGFAPPSAPGSFDPFSASGEGFDPASMTESGFDPPSAPGGFDPFSASGEGFDPASMTEGGFAPPSAPGGFEGGMPGFSGGGPGMGGMGDSDVRLQYTDDDPDSYQNIWNGAKTNPSNADRQRLIASLKALSEDENPESVVDVEAVIRYLVVHHFVCNDDSYTGMMVHNYYLYEEDGMLSLIPWDYNLSLGGFSMGGMGGGSGATSTVNSPIDSPVSGGSIESRPMVCWIFSDPAYTDLYHERYAEFIAEVFDSGWFESHMRSVIDMIAPYVERDINGFFSFDEFKKGSETMLAFCALRAESIRGQLNGSIPSTTAAQRADSSALINADHLSLSDMGEFGMGGGFSGGPRSSASDGNDVPAGQFPGGGRGGHRMNRQSTGEKDASDSPDTGKPGFRGGMPEGFPPPGVPGSAASQTASSYGIILSALCAASLLIALVWVKRCKPHQ